MEFFDLLASTITPRKILLKLVYRKNVVGRFYFRVSASVTTGGNLLSHFIQRVTNLNTAGSIPPKFDTSSGEN